MCPKISPTAITCYLIDQSTDNMIELTYADRRRFHNLKSYTWVEQQGRAYEEINAKVGLL